MTDTTISADDPIGLDDAAIEALLSGIGSAVLCGSRDMAPGALPLGNEPLIRALAELRALGAGPAPKPSPDLDFMMGAKIIPLYPPQKHTRSRVKITGAFAAAASVALGLTWTAAAQQQLPDDAQGVVSRVVNNLTPFHVEPTGRHHDGDSNGNGNPNQPGALPTGSTGQPTSTPSAGASNNPADPKSTAPNGTSAGGRPSPASSPAGNVGGANPDPANTGAHGPSGANTGDPSATPTQSTTDASSPSPSPTPSPTKPSGAPGSHGGGGGNGGGGGGANSQGQSGRQNTTTDAPLGAVASGR